MNYNELQNTVMGLIQSNSLKFAIKETGKVFKPIELVKIAFEYAESYDQRLNILSLIKTSLCDESLKRYIEKLIETQKEIHKKFLQNQENCIYELYIKESPDSYDERYLCDSYFSAVKMIDLFYERYGNGENELSRYEIEKRKIFSSTDKFDEDYVGNCKLNYKREIQEIDIDDVKSYANICDAACSDECNILCINNIDIEFPRFAENLDVVEYFDRAGKKHYGVYLENMSDINEEYYVIPLDCDAMRYHHFERDFYNHEHIKAPFVEKVDISNIPEQIQEVYQSYVEYLEKTGGI
ncbi:MAG: hypothetical protein IJO50_03720 [Clostridia bacterium]|nr:hypothetical protein [Clostridia bacterium]